MIDEQRKLLGWKKMEKSYENIWSEK